MAFLMCGFTMTSQHKGVPIPKIDKYQEYKMARFADQVNIVANENTTTADKNERLMNIVASFMADHSRAASETTLKSELSVLHDDVRRKDVLECLTAIARKCKTADCHEYLLALTSPKNRVSSACFTAGQIALKVGVDNIADLDLCASADCDNNKSVNVKSRGAATAWVFVGERRFFTEADNFGYRYLCKEEPVKDSGSGLTSGAGVEDAKGGSTGSTKGGGTGIVEGEMDGQNKKETIEDEDPGQIDKEEFNFGDDMVYPEDNLAWKKQENVDDWGGN